MTQSRVGTTTNEVEYHFVGYTHDDNSNITTIRDIKNSDQWQCFTYDALDRLTTAYTDNTSACNGHTAVGAGNYNESFAYSSGGNLTSKTGQGTFTYGDTNHKHAVTATSAGGSFSYDANGNMTSRNPAGAAPAQMLAWNNDQRLATVTEGSTVTEHRYDADGGRIRRQTGDDYSYYYQGGEYHHDDGAGTGEFTHYHTLGGSIVAMTIDGELTWTYGDQIGSTSLTRTASGVNKVQRYTPWGEIRTDGNLTNDRHFTGQINDQTTGLYHYNARYYDPGIGRFISPDTIIPNPADGQHYNRYSYVLNNPIKYSDPSGHETCIEHTDGSTTCWSDLEMISQINDAEKRGEFVDPYMNPDNFSTTSNGVRQITFGSHGTVTLNEAAHEPTQEEIDLWVFSSAKDLVDGLLGGEIRPGSSGVCGEGEVGLAWGGTGQTCVMRTNDGDFYATSQVTTGPHLGETTAVTGGVLWSSTDDVGLIPSVDGSVCVEMSALALEGVGAGVCFATTTSAPYYDESSWTVEIFGGVGQGASVGFYGGGQVTYQLPG